MRQLLLDQRDEICFRGGDRIAREERSARTSLRGPSPIGAHSRVEVVPMVINAAVRVRGQVESLT